MRAGPGAAAAAAMLCSLGCSIVGEGRAGAPGRPGRGSGERGSEKGGSLETDSGRSGKRPGCEGRFGGSSSGGASDVIPAPRFGRNEGTAGAERGGSSRRGGRGALVTLQRPFG